MIEVDPNDFRPLDTFRLRWRWTDSTWALLSPEELRQIQPLTEAKARELWRWTLTSSNGLYRTAQGLAPRMPAASERFTSFAHITTAAMPHSIVTQELAALVAAWSEPVAVVWNPTDAVVVAWEVLCAHWDAFCYPASDDVSIRPLDESWCLEWHHEGYFLFGRP